MYLLADLLIDSTRLRKSADDLSHFNPTFINIKLPAFEAGPELGRFLGYRG